MVLWQLRSWVAAGISLWVACRRVGTGCSAHLAIAGGVSGDSGAVQSWHSQREKSTNDQSREESMETLARSLPSSLAVTGSLGMLTSGCIKVTIGRQDLGIQVDAEGLRRVVVMRRSGAGSRKQI